jgi:hypothetical protein
MPQVKEITNGQPEDVVAFIERMVECNHWGGEELTTRSAPNR